MSTKSDDSGFNSISPTWPADGLDTVTVREDEFNRVSGGTVIYDASNPSTRVGEITTDDGIPPLGDSFNKLRVKTGGQLDPLFSTFLTYSGDTTP